MNKRKKYSIYIVFVIVILLGYIYIMNQMNCAESLVKKTIEQSIVGNINDLPISENDKNTLQSFYTNEVNLDLIKSSIRLINKTNESSEFLVNFEQINYAKNNEVKNVIHGYLLIEVEHSSIFKCNIVNIEIKRELS